MPRYLQVLVNSLFFFALLQTASSRALAEDIWVTAGTPVGLTASSNPGAPSSTPCGPDNSYTCYGGSVPPNGNIHWTVDGAPASSSYDTVKSSGEYCSADGNVNYYTYCYSYWDESGFSAVLPPGDHVVTASIPTSQDYNAAFSTSWTVHVAKPVPSLSVSCSPNPITFGNQNTNCIASQSAGTGSLSWTINGGGWTTTEINGSAGGFAGWGAGNYTIGVTYSGDNDYASTSASTTLTINKSALDVVVSCLPNPIPYGSQTSTCTAQTPGGSGTIATYWDGNPWCSGAAPGPVSCTGWNGQPVGNHTFSANYSGDGNYNPASKSTTLVINRGPAPLSVSCSPNVLKFGQQTTCTASVPGGTGTVTFYSPTTLTGQWWNGNSGSWYPPSGGNLSDQPVAITHDGALNYNLSQSGSPSTWPGAVGGPAGMNHDYFYVRWMGTFVSSIGGTYTIGLNSDDGANLYVNGTQIVSNLGTVQGAVGNLTYMQSGTINLAAGVTNTIVIEYQQGYGDSGIQLLWTPPGAPSPSLLGWSAVPLDSGGHASVSGPILVAGNSTVTAAYSGDGTYNPATGSTSVTTTANTVIDVVSNINPSTVGQGVTFMSLVNTGGVQPTGNVSIRDGGSEIGSASPNPITATNLLSYSQQFGNSTWGGYCGPTSNMTVNTGDIAAPDGSYTATKFVAPNSFGCGQSSSWGVLTNIPGGLKEGKTYTASVWLRGANGGENVIIALNDCSGVGVTLTTSWTRYVATYSSIPAGIANCSTGPRGFQVLDNSSPNATFYVWGAQTEMSDHIGPYIQTDASARSGYGGIASFSTNALSQGTHSITAKYQGDAATVASTSSSIPQYVSTPPPPPPSISGITPASGYRGSTVTITGMNFGASQGNGFVTFNGQNAGVSSWSDISITARVPFNATSGNVVVTVNGAASNGVFYTVNILAPGSTLYSYQIKDSTGNSGYAPNSNIIAYTDSVNGTWSNIGYDSLNRLTNATQSVNGGTQYLCWSYDSFGNRTSNVCNPSSPIQYTASNQDPRLGYDSGGNVTNDGRNQYLYDAEGRVCAVKYSIPGMTGMIGMIGYLYDAEGHRVAKGTISQWNCDFVTSGDPSQVNVFTETAGYVLGPSGEPMSETDGAGNWVYTNVVAGGELIATYTLGGLSFHLNDWLGTRRLDTDMFGDPGASYQSLPFGELLSPAQTITSPENFFTGKERDTESGLDNFDARYFGSTMGRFMSPDWDDEPSAVPFADFGNPQTLNLYAYGRNNPLRYADPDGHDVRVCDNNGQCNTISNDAYTAAQKGNNGGLNVPTLNQVGMNGNGSGQFNSTSITDANGNSVGSATYVSNGGADYYANRNGFDMLAQTSATVGSVKGVAAFYGASLVGAVGVYAAGATAGGELLVTGIEGDTSAIEFGKTAEQTAHALRHVIEEGLNPQEVQAAIKADIVQNGGVQAGSNTRYIQVAGKLLRYNAHRLANGAINVGKIVIH